MAFWIERGSMIEPDAIPGGNAVTELTDCVAVALEASRPPA
jgi:hypothetical protein